MNLYLGKLLIICVLALSLTGCGSKCRVGKPFQFNLATNRVLFAVAGMSIIYETNKHGESIRGLELRNASLIRSEEDISQSQKEYLLFGDRFFGNLALGLYWEQQARKQAGLGLPIMNTDYTKVNVIKVDSNRIVRHITALKIAHVTMSVAPEDFARNYHP